jgi:SAM-dependent methyltransferase
MVIDVGSRRWPGELDVRTLFPEPCRYVGVDLDAGQYVDVVASDSYRLPFATGAADVVIAGSMFEHVPYFWVLLGELKRLLRKGGILILSMPSRGHAHLDFDAWRFYGDAFRAMAAWSDLQLLEQFVDEAPMRPSVGIIDYAAIDSKLSYWGDAVGVFRNPGLPLLRQRLLGVLMRRWISRLPDLATIQAEYSAGDARIRIHRDKGRFLDGDDPC